MTATTVDSGTAVTRVLAASPAAVGLARDMVRGVLWNSRLHVSEDDAVLVMGELAANAVRASARARQIRILVRSEQEDLLLGVWDEAEGGPNPRPHDEDSTSLEGMDSGWGLHIVEALTTRYWTEQGRPTGKWVYGLLPAGTEVE